MKKRIVCLTLAILMCGSQVVSVMADRESDLREEQAWTSQQLDATYARMSALWDQKQQLESQIESLNSDLVNVMVSIQTLESDIASKEAEIEKTQGDLTKAQNAKDKQYSAMKKRIQYLYGASCLEIEVLKETFCLSIKFPIVCSGFLILFSRYIIATLSSPN